MLYVVCCVSKVSISGHGNVERGLRKLWSCFAVCLKCKYLILNALHVFGNHVKKIVDT